MDAGFTTIFTWIVIAYLHAFHLSKCNSYTYTSLNCNFTKDQCGWTDTDKTVRPYKWKHMYNRTMSLTGSSSNYNKTSRLQSVQFSTGKSINICLIFTYDIELVDNNLSGILQIYINNTEYEEELTFRTLPVEKNGWKQGEFDLSMNRATNYTIVFEGRHIFTTRSNISIDSVRVQPGFCAENISEATTIRPIQTTNNEADGGLNGGLVIGVLIVILIIAFVVYKQRNSSILQCKPNAKSPELIPTSKIEQSVANVENNKTSLSQPKNEIGVTSTLNKHIESENTGLNSDTNVHSTKEHNVKVHDATAENSYMLFDGGQYNTLNGVFYMKSSETMQNVYSHTIDNVYDVADKRRIDDNVNYSIDNVYDVASKDRNTENVQYSMFP